MKKTINILLSLAAVLAAGVSCSNKEEAIGGGSSTEGYFFKEVFNYNISDNPVIELPVVRLGNSGDLTVNLEATGDVDLFKVPSSVTIKDGDRMAPAIITYTEGSVPYNTPFSLKIKVAGYTSIYGFEGATVNIERPTLYSKYGKGTVYEDWWGEEEPDKELFVRDYSDNVLQCYIPACWGHDTGPGYDVQDYVFFWNTKTNKCYVPVQYMGYRWISDMGAHDCQFGGPGHTPGSADWMAFIDNYYAGQDSAEQPRFDPEKKTFYLSDSGDFKEDGSGAEFTKNDTFVLDE